MKTPPTCGGESDHMDTAREDVSPSAHSEGLKAEVVNLPKSHAQTQAEGFAVMSRVTLSCSAAIYQIGFICALNTTKTRNSR